MATSERDRTRIAAFLEGGGPRPAEFRQRFPGVPFMACGAGDMNSKEPYRRHAGFGLYLIDGSGHCVCLTTDPASATGLVVAWHARAAVQRKE